MTDIVKVKQGDEFAPKASTWNAFIDAANYTKQALGGKTPTKGAIPPDSGIVLVKNVSGDPHDRYSALAITDVVVDPDDNEDEFKRRIVLEADVGTETTGNKWCVLQRALPDGSLGPAVISGLTICWINLQDVHDLYVDLPESDDVPHSSYFGSASIIWVSGGVGDADDTGEQWAVIRLGDSSGQNVLLKITGAAQDGDNFRWEYTARVAKQTGTKWDGWGGRPVASACAFQ